MFRAGKVLEAGCWAHARRKFFEAHKLNRSEIAKLALDWIGKLYSIEREAQELDEVQRLAIRQAQSVSLLEEFKTWLMGQRMKLVSADVTAKAIDYTLKRWGALIVHVNDARVPVDNNAVENMMRPIALGRNNANCSLMRTRWLSLRDQRGMSRLAAFRVKSGLHIRSQRDGDAVRR